MNGKADKFDLLEVKHFLDILPHALVNRQD